jgi:hypothetical protein
MIPLPIQILAILASLIYLLLILLALRSSRMNVRQSLLWLMSAVVFLVLSLCPGLLVRAGFELGFVAPSNALFLLWCLTLTMLVFYQALTTSKQNEEIRSLAQALAIERLKHENLLRIRSAGSAKSEPSDSAEGG